MAAKWQKVQIDVPDGLTDSEREQLGKDIIEFIIDRTKQGYDKRGSRFPKYSKDYIASKDFKIAGKSPADVNLTLSGDMLAAIEVLDHKPGKITIGFERGSGENDRADGNIRGTYGSDSPKRGKKRDFLGIESADLKVILGLYE